MRTDRGSKRHPWRQKWNRLAWLSIAIVTGWAYGCDTSQTGATIQPPSNETVEDPVPVLDRPAVVIRSVFPGGAGDIYGLRQGDILTRWIQPGPSEEAGEAEESQDIQTVFDARRVEEERAADGELLLELYREQQILRVPVPSGWWEVELEAFDPKEASIDSLETGPSSSQDAPSSRTPAESSGPGADAMPEISRTLWTDRAERALRRGHPISRWYRFRAGQSSLEAGDFETARHHFASSLEEHPELPSLSVLDRAIGLQMQGLAWKAARQPTDARAALQEALRLREDALPGSPAVAATLIHIGELLGYAAGHHRFLEAREILSRQVPDSVEEAYVLNRLGIVAAKVEQDLDKAIGLYQEALRIRQDRLSASFALSATLSNLAQCAREQSRLDDAEEFILDALDQLAVAPETRTWRAYWLNVLAQIQRDKGSYREARMAWEEALDIFRELAPESPPVAGVANNLGNLSLRVGDLDRARRRYQESLDLRRRLRPDSSSVAESLNNLGNVAIEQGDLGDARRLLEESLALKQKLAPATMSLANTLSNLGQIEFLEDRLKPALERFEAALAIRLAVAPDHVRVAENLIQIGQTRLALGQAEEGIRSWTAGIDLLERTRTGFRFSAQERSIFASRFQDHYRDLAAVLVARKRPAEAFDLLERSRARALRSMDRAVSPRGDDTTEGSRIEQPALDLATIRESLSPGTRLILYSIGKEEILAGVVEPGSASPPGVTFRRWATERSDLQRRVELFRALLARGQHQSGIEPPLAHLGGRLYDELLRPIQDLLESADRLLIVPDRPISTLPFAALVAEDSPRRFVGAWKPLSFAASGTVFANAKQRRQTDYAPATITLFARSEAPRLDAEEREQLPALPGVEEEAARLTRLFGSRSRLLTNGEATESAVKRGWGATRDQAQATDRSPSSQYLHFATHALTDERSPLDSSLLLAPSEGEDGKLQAWEIIEQLTLDSDLVTLSACESGLGRDLSGEGVLGLSHAFLFSGARTILTSLWPVSDRATADWMEAFYRALEAGEDRDVAVMAAQRTVTQTKGYEHPYYWAAFQLWGDWGGVD